MDNSVAYLILAAVLFAIGGVGLLVRRNPLVMFMCVELMLNAVNVTFVALGAELNDVGGQIARKRQRPTLEPIREVGVVAAALPVAPANALEPRHPSSADVLSHPLLALLLTNV